MKTFSVVLLFITLLSSCKSDESNFDSKLVMSSVAQNSANYSLKLIQSKLISENVGYFNDFRNGIGIGVSKDRKKVIVYEENDEKIRSYNIVGEGPGKTGEIYFTALLDDSRFVVFDVAYAYVYSIDGSLLSKCGPFIDKINYDRYSNPVVISENEVFIPAISPYIEIVSNEYFYNPEVFFYAKINLDDCTVITGGNLDKTNIYRDEFFAVRMRPLIQKMNNDTILSLFPFNRSIELVESKKMKLVGSINLKPENFGTLVTATGSYVEDQALVIQLNSAYRHILYSDDGQVLLQYKKGRDEAISSTELLNSVDGLKIGGDKFYEIYDLNQKRKVTSDIKDNIGYIPLAFLNTDTLLFYSNTHDDQEGFFLHYVKIVVE
jgi:hypothetical protein